MDPDTEQGYKKIQRVVKTVKSLFLKVMHCEL